MGVAKYQDISGRGLRSGQMAGIGLVGAAVIVVVAMVFTMMTKGVFQQTFLVNIRAEQVGEGIVVGADVKMNGLRIGHVTKIETHGSTSQSLQLGLTPENAGFLADNVQARFVSSNTLGMSAVELFYFGPRGNPLRNGATIMLPANSKTVTVTSMLNMVSDKFREIDTGPVGRIAASLMFEGSASGIGNMLKTAIDFGMMRVGTGQMLVGLDPRPYITGADQFLQGGAGTVQYLTDGFRAEQGRINFLVDHAEDEEALMVFVGHVFRQVLDLSTTPGLPHLFEAIIQFAGPLSTGAKGITGFYDRIPQLLDQIDRSFQTNPDGSVSLRLQLLLANLPYLVGDRGHR